MPFLTGLLETHLSNGVLEEEDFSFYPIPSKSRDLDVSGIFQRASRSNRLRTVRRRDPTNNLPME